MANDEKRKRSAAAVYLLSGEKFNQKNNENKL